MNMKNRRDYVPSVEINESVFIPGVDLYEIIRKSEYQASIKAIQAELEKKQGFKEAVEGTNGLSQMIQGTGAFGKLKGQLKAEHPEITKGMGAGEIGTLIGIVLSAALYYYIRRIDKKYERIKEEHYKNLDDKDKDKDKEGEE